MNDEHPLLQRLMHFDKTALGELEKLSTKDPEVVYDIAWRFITRIAEESRHVSAGFVHGSLILMQKALGPHRTESVLLDAWAGLGEETRLEVCYSGISNPRCLSNAFCERLFDAPGTVPIRRTIFCSLYSTLEQRCFPVARWIMMFDQMEADDRRECQKYVEEVRQRLQTSLDSDS